MRPQDHLEFFNKRNRSVMFFLSFDVTTHLRNLRLAHRERAISFLPRESCGLSKRSRNPPGRIRLQLTDKFRDRFVLPQFRENVNVIGSSIHDYRDAIFRADSPAKILMNSRTDGSRHPRLATLCREDDVIQEIAIGGTHRNAPFRRPSSGALICSDDTPGVPLRSTPGFIPPHPSGAVILVAPSSTWRAESNQRPRREGVKPFIPPHCSGAPILDASGSTWRAEFNQRRRREGLKPRAERSGAPGNRGIHIIKPLKGVVENVARISASAH